MTWRPDANASGSEQWGISCGNREPERRGSQTAAGYRPHVNVQVRSTSLPFSIQRIRAQYVVPFRSGVSGSKASEKRFFGIDACAGASGDENTVGTTRPFSLATRNSPLAGVGGRAPNAQSA